MLILPGVSGGTEARKQPKSEMHRGMTKAGDVSPEKGALFPFLSAACIEKVHLPVGLRKSIGYLE